MPSTAAAVSGGCALTFTTGDHTHVCTGPMQHGGQEHLCTCGEWWTRLTL
jgi:hypothetical protein